MNEIIFFSQIILILGFAFIALKIGKEALISWVTIQALIANLFVLKQIHLFGLNVTASDAFAIGSLLGLNFLQEYFHREEANKATWICFFFMLFFGLISQLHLVYQPNTHDTTQSSYLAILTHSPRLLFASLTVFFITQQIDIHLFAWLKRKLPRTSFAMRAAITLMVSQFLDTFLFSFAGLYGIVISMIDIIIISFLIKVIVIFSFSSLMKWASTKT